MSQFEGNSKFVGLWDGLVNKSDMRIRNAVIKFVKEVLHSLPECFKPKKKTMKFEENFVEPKNGFK